ncbi:MAG: phosphopyruvate hydratase [Myxococcota bacterium]|jgi:enolase|nr:phosphopyruvate hydratase [Myxococcota bacterium]
MGGPTYGDGESPDSPDFQNKSYKKTRKKRRRTDAFSDDQVVRGGSLGAGLEKRAPDFHAGIKQKGNLLNFRIGEANKTQVQSMSSAIQLEATLAQDSRGRDTVSVFLKLGEFKVFGDVPAGASTGEDEANTVESSVALANIENKILPLIRDLDVDLSVHQNLIQLEQAIAKMAGPNYVDLGANATVPVSRALWRMAAKLQGQELCAYISKHCSTSQSKRPVRFFMNIFNGGLHALRDGEALGRDRIDIQEVMIVPRSASSYQEALEMGDAIDQALKNLLYKDFSPDDIMRADEAGFSVKGLGESRRAIKYVMQAIEDAGFIPGQDVQLALDVAASSFYDVDSGKYAFQGKQVSAQSMIDYYVSLADDYPGKIVSIEDGLGENDWASWPALSAELSKREILSIGDDLFVTQMTRLRRGVNEKSASAILIKVNQNGNMLGTIEVMNHAQEHGLECIVSHRSGETLDDSIADLAQGMRSFGLKTGDPQPVADFPDQQNWMRRAKYLRMVEIENIRGV